MIKRQQIEERIKSLRRKSFHTENDLGQLSILLWLIEDWDWETEKAILESKLATTITNKTQTNSRAPIG